MQLKVAVCNTAESSGWNIGSAGTALYPVCKWKTKEMPLSVFRDPG